MSNTIFHTAVPLTLANVTEKGTSLNRCFESISDNLIDHGSIYSFFLYWFSFLVSRPTVFVFLKKKNLAEKTASLVDVNPISLKTL